MDVVTLGAAKAAAIAGSLGSTHMALISSRLQANNEDVVLSVLGDSTGVTVGTAYRWPYIVAQRVATAYPAYTVKHYGWNDGAQNYDAATTIQTGTGTHTFSVYNGSTSGAGAIYSTTRLALQVPIAPHVIIVSYGHNDATTGAVYRGNHYTLTRQLEDWFPSAGLVMTAQNPRAAADAGYVLGMSRNQAIIDLADSEGYGLINITQAFLNDPNYATNLLNVDGIHPNDAGGSPLWASVVMKQITRSLSVQPRGIPRRAHRIWVPATAFVASEGAPTLGWVNNGGSGFEAWSLDQTTQQGVLATVDIPDWWATVNYYLIWSWISSSGYTAGNNGARWELSVGRFASYTGPFDSPPTNKNIGTIGVTPAAAITGSASNGGGYGHSLLRLLSAYGVSGRPQMIRIRRLAADALDNLGETAYLRGVIIERAS